MAQQAVRLAAEHPNLAQLSARIPPAGSRLDRDIYADGCCSATERRTREGGTVVIWSDVTHPQARPGSPPTMPAAPNPNFYAHEPRTAPPAPTPASPRLVARRRQGTLGVQQREYIDHIETGYATRSPDQRGARPVGAIEAGKQAIEIDDVRLSRLLMNA